MIYFKINNQDFSSLVQSMKLGYETLVADNSGRNANGDTVLDIINHKVKVYITFRPMDGNEMKRLLAAMNDYVVNISFFDSKKNALTTIKCYTGTPEPQYYWIHKDSILYKPMSLNFIEL